MSQKPRVERLDKAFVIVRGDGATLEYWNMRREKWIRRDEIHGPSAQNPKASYFRSWESALRRSITPPCTDP